MYIGVIKTQNHLYMHGPTHRHIYEHAVAPHALTIVHI